MLIERWLAWSIPHTESVVWYVIQSSGAIGRKGKSTSLLYNLDFTASNQNMPLKIIQAIFCGKEIWNHLSFRLAGQQDNLYSQL